MEYRLVPYQKSYQDQCVDLMTDTWNFNSLFPGLKKENLVNKVFFNLATIGADYSQLIVDENGKVAGYIFGVLDLSFSAKVIRFWKSLGYFFVVLYYFLAGHFGPRVLTLKRSRELFSMEASLESLKEKNDAYVSLFLVSSTLRGQGWGKKLMDCFHTRCEDLSFRRIYLWTDKGCNFHFYDRQGFQRIYSLGSPYLSQYGSGPNGFVYTKSVG